VPPVMSRVLSLNIEFVQWGWSLSQLNSAMRRISSGHGGGW
jgi:hypothetical protein